MVKKIKKDFGTAWATIFYGLKQIVHTILFLFLVSFLAFHSLEFLNEKYEKLAVVVCPPHATQNLIISRCMFVLQRTAKKYSNMSNIYNARA